MKPEIKELAIKFAEIAQAHIDKEEDKDEAYDNVAQAMNFFGAALLKVVLKDVDDIAEVFEEKRT